MHVQDGSKKLEAGRRGAAELKIHKVGRAIKNGSKNVDAFQ